MLSLYRFFFYPKEMKQEIYRFHKDGDLNGDVLRYSSVLEILNLFSLVIMAALIIYLSMFGEVVEQDVICTLFLFWLAIVALIKWGKVKAWKNCYKVYLMGERRNGQILTINHICGDAICSSKKYEIYMRDSKDSVTRKTIGWKRASIAMPIEEPQKGQIETYFLYEEAGKDYAVFGSKDFMKYSCLSKSRIVGEALDG